MSTKNQERFVGMTKTRFRERLWDMFLGASKGYSLDSLDDRYQDSLLMVIGLEEWLGWVAAVELEFGSRLHEWVFRVRDLHRFETINGAVEACWGSRLPEISGGSK